MCHLVLAQVNSWGGVGRSWFRKTLRIILAANIVLSQQKIPEKKKQHSVLFPNFTICEQLLGATPWVQYPWRKPDLIHTGMHYTGLGFVIQGLVHEVALPWEVPRHKKKK